MRLRRVVVSEPAEEEIVGSRFAKLQRIVARLDAARADHHPVLQSVDRRRRAAACRPSRWMPSALDPSRNPGVAGNHGRDARFLRDRNETLGQRLERGLMQAVCRQNQRGDVAALNAASMRIVGRARRRDQHDAAAVWAGWVRSLVSIQGFAYAGRRWLHCGIEQSARLEQAGKQDAACERRPTN